jgi:hypothetical protein
MAEYSSRSNDPRVTKGAKKDKYKYDMALEVARQPADTPQGKRMKKDAQNYVRAFESRFQNEAFDRSGRMPYTAGGKGAAKDLQKVDKNAKDGKGIKATKKQVEKVRAVAKLVAPFAPVKKTKMTQKKTPMKPGTNPKIGAKPAVKKTGKK